MGPRERFSGTRLVLERLYEATPPPFRLVVVDAGSPPRVRQYLRREARARGFDLVVSPDGTALSPIAARTVGFDRVDTPYVVFLDNDVVVAPGWLDALLACAEETGAWITTPVYCVDRPFHAKVHMAGGIARVKEVGGVRRFLEGHTHLHRPLAAVRESLVRAPCDQGEFHCLLLRTDAMRRLGPFDERFLAATEVQIDLCLRARALGGGVWFEPRAVVTYDRPSSIAASDLPYFLARWDPERCRAGLEHFRTRWGLSPDDPYFAQQAEFARWHRARALEPWLSLLRPFSRATRRRAAERAARITAALATMATGATGP
jgi:GT2 family glycosyltransferase